MAGQGQVLRCHATLRSAPHGQVSMSALVRGHIRTSDRPIVQQRHQRRVVVWLQNLLRRTSATCTVLKMILLTYNIDGHPASRDYLVSVRGGS